VRTRAALGGMLASAGILIVGWQIGGATAVQTTSSTAGATGSGTSTSTTTTAPAPGATASAAAGTDGTWTGSNINTRFGPVQVQVTIASGQITEVTALRLTDADGRSVQISNRAEPILRREVLASQSAQVSNVSGATYTSQAYVQSLQSALDQAGM
jgi:uncharacterized protein with FMN-binding domain